MINSRSISDLRVDVAHNCRIWLALCRAKGLNPMITNTLRDNEYQAMLYAQGRTKPGQIVTKSKTTTFHGKGLAWDFCKNEKGHEYDDLRFFADCAQIAKQMGFSWGGDWKGFVDRPHIQWDNKGKYTTAMLKKGVVCPQMPGYGEENDEMDAEKFIDGLTPEQAYRLLKKADAYEAMLPMPLNWNASEQLAKAVENGITDGSRPMARATRLETSLMANRACEKAVKEILANIKGG